MLQRTPGLFLVLGLLVAAGCPARNCGGPATPAQTARVEVAARALYTSYLGASTGDQARAALQGGVTSGFIDWLQATAKQCRDGATPAAECDVDPVTCQTGKATLTTVVVQTVSGHTATATAVITPDGGAPMNVRLSLVDDGGWKVSGVDCPR